MLSWKIRSFIY